MRTTEVIRTKIQTPIATTQTKTEMFLHAYCLFEYTHFMEFAFLQNSLGVRQQSIV